MKAVCFFERVATLTGIVLDVPTSVEQSRSRFVAVRL
jgi:hypothetical protein